MTDASFNDGAFGSGWWFTEYQGGEHMRIHRIDHVGIVVNDLAAAIAFFLDFGLDMLGEGEVEGDWVERIIGLQDVRAQVAMLRTPDGETNIELVKYHTPSDGNGIQPSLANTLGIRHIAFAVENIEALVAKLRGKGAVLFGEIQNYENAYKLCYVRGPEGIILELAEKIE
jgi:catechol 2,3-dioxygenase-like lactoylglutathione lyase family enzyme